MAVKANALTTLAKVKTELGITDSARDALLEGYIDVASSAIERRCGRKFQRITVTAEAHEGTGTKQLLVDRTPLVSITSIEEDGTALESDDYEIEDADAGIIRREDGWAASGRSCIGISLTPVPGTGERTFEVTYVGGFALPNDEVLAGVTASESSDVQTLESPAAPVETGALVVTTSAGEAGAADYVVTWKGEALCSGSIAAGELPGDVDLGEHSEDLEGFTLTVEEAEASEVSYAVVGTDTAVEVTLPPELEKACVETVKALYHAQARDPAVASESIGDYSVTYGGVNTAIGCGVGGIIPDGVLPLVDMFRRLG